MVNLTMNLILIHASLIQQGRGEFLTRGPQWVNRSRSELSPHLEDLGSPGDQTTGASFHTENFRGAGKSTSKACPYPEESDWACDTPSNTAGSQLICYSQMSLAAWNSLKA